MTFSGLNIRAFLAVAVVGFGFISVNCISDGQEIGLQGFPQLSIERDWPWWRGPFRDGRTSASSVPSEFSETKNVRWRADVPGRGHSSPIVVGNLVILTTADESAQIQSVVSFDRASGKQAWKTDVSQGGFPKNNHPKNTAASPTLACDGKSIFATFFHHNKILLNVLGLDGKILSEKDLMAFKPTKFEYGYAPSPVLYRNSVIVVGEYDGESFIQALDRVSGDLLWKTKRPNNITFSSPVVAHVAGKDQLLISGSNLVSAYAPDTGNLLWQVDGTTDATCGTMVWEGDTVFASGGYPKAETIAVSADGSKKILWKNNQKCYEQSMLVHQGYVYALTDKGILFCWRGTDGKEMWQKRLKGPVSASPVLVGDLIYWANELGTHYVFRASPVRFEMVAQNELGSESFASPAVVGKELFLRVANQTGNQRQEVLYCITNP
ncbi:MAG: PQQ-binding-like beta-propeller repeat protein [Pirellulaceae bacterium]|nr:PQQ-binding-like beta-propeller repeat protein [Pirellulaceae bacterium]